MLKVKVPVAFLGTQGFSWRLEEEVIVAYLIVEAGCLGALYRQ
jgi:hypothetical protein